MRDDQNPDTDHAQNHSPTETVAVTGVGALDLTLRWIEEHGGSTTVRELQRGLHRHHPRAKDAKGALDLLDSQGRGHWEDEPPGPRGGRPKRRFQLSDNTSPKNGDTTAATTTPGEEVLSTDPGGEDAKMDRVEPRATGSVIGATAATEHQGDEREVEDEEATQVDISREETADALPAGDVRESTSEKPDTELRCDDNTAPAPGSQTNRPVTRPRRRFVTDYGPREVPPGLTPKTQNLYGSQVALGSGSHLRRIERRDR